ncbi:Mediator of RNA polymerase II transcription subunit 10 [Porphyridium purpureum]|uniref:Mediator of RNA polymerase II transcription subunit 10 n=1 Tax=Porphyridium purpureum TaxID=35688 RepID=A0A5J4YM45_PORPP|nr:Mediator of RNA polymerase II transcription subunit 10 [Porphyridium purpureum]|eukprot:POR6590..scf249_10
MVLSIGHKLSVKMETHEVVSMVAAKDGEDDDIDFSQVEEVNALVEDAAQLLERARAGTPASAVALERALVKTVNTLGAIAETACIFTAQEQNSALRALIVQLVQELAEVMQCAERLEQETHMQVPVDIVLGVDQGRNPYACARQLLENLAEKDAQVSGKRRLLNTFSSTLSEYVHQVSSLDAADGHGAEGTSAPDATSASVELS